MIFWFLSPFIHVILGVVSKFIHVILGVVSKLTTVFLGKPPEALYPQYLVYIWAQ